MGLFDSRDGATDEGSTGQIAKWLRAPVVLVVDCWAMARSAAALVKGYAEFDAGEDCLRGTTSYGLLEMPSQHQLYLSWCLHAVLCCVMLCSLCCMHVSLCADLQFAGVLFNKVGSAGHGTWLTQALEAAWQQGRLKQSIKVLGCIPKVMNHTCSSTCCSDMTLVTLCSIVLASAADGWQSMVPHDAACQAFTATVLATNRAQLG